MITKKQAETWFDYLISEETRKRMKEDFEKLRLEQKKDKKRHMKMKKEWIKSRKKMLKEHE